MQRCIDEREGQNTPVLLEVKMTIQSVVQEGKKVYETIRPSIELKFPNQYVAIDPRSKEYFIDVSLGQALAKAQSRFPNREFYTVQIGRETAMSMMR